MPKQITPCHILQVFSTELSSSGWTYHALVRSEYIGTTDEYADWFHTHYNGKYRYQQESYGHTIYHRFYTNSPKQRS